MIFQGQHWDRTGRLRLDLCDHVGLSVFYKKREGVHNDEAVRSPRVSVIRGQVLGAFNRYGFAFDSLQLRQIVLTISGFYKTYSKILTSSFQFTSKVTSGVISRSTESF